MRERPILFSAPMVRAILAGTKAQTRRVVKPQPNLSGLKTYQPSSGRTWGERDAVAKLHDDGWHFEIPGAAIGSWRCPYGQPGDRLWVRETWRHTASSVEEARALTEDIMSGTAVDWRATYLDCCMKELGFSRKDAEIADSFQTWRPSIHMPRWASRINLDVTGVRVERLQDISESDAQAEGCANSLHLPGGRFANENFAHLWWQINGDGSWEANPWVWVVEFKRRPA